MKRNNKIIKELIVVVFIFTGCWIIGFTAIKSAWKISEAIVFHWSENTSLIIVLGIIIMWLISIEIRMNKNAVKNN